MYNIANGRNKFLQARNAHGSVGFVLSPKMVNIYGVPKNIRVLNCVTHNVMHKLYFHMNYLKMIQFFSR